MYYQMENIENFRDLGGIVTTGNKKVKEGKLFRCADLSSATENDIEKIKQLGIDTIIDFRSTAETPAKKIRRLKTSDIIISILLKINLTV